MNEARGKQTNIKKKNVILPFVDKEWKKMKKTKAFFCFPKCFIRFPTGIFIFIFLIPFC